MTEVVAKTIEVGGLLGIGALLAGLGVFFWGLRHLSGMPRKSWKNWKEG
ncbi:MAG: hypothetical protein JW732_04285 [Dehalococcoidia bacterium]|nr:hypothetical protein [Dehalococcoidia bacterium]